MSGYNGGNGFPRGGNRPGSGIYRGNNFALTSLVGKGNGSNFMQSMNDVGTNRYQQPSMRLSSQFTQQKTSFQDENCFPGRNFSFDDSLYTNGNTDSGFHSMSSRDMRQNMSMQRPSSGFPNAPSKLLDKGGNSRNFGGFSPSVAAAALRPGFGNNGRPMSAPFARQHGMGNFGGQNDGNMSMSAKKSPTLSELQRLSAAGARGNIGARDFEANFMDCDGSMMNNRQHMQQKPQMQQQQQQIRQKQLMQQQQMRIAQAQRRRQYISDDFDPMFDELPMSGSANIRNYSSFPPYEREQFRPSYPGEMADYRSFPPDEMDHFGPSFAHNDDRYFDPFNHLTDEEELFLHRQEQRQAQIASGMRYPPRAGLGNAGASCRPPLIAELSPPMKQHSSQVVRGYISLHNMRKGKSGLFIISIINSQLRSRLLYDGPPVVFSSRVQENVLEAAFPSIEVLRAVVEELCPIVIKREVTAYVTYREPSDGSSSDTSALQQHLLKTTQLTQASKGAPAGKSPATKTPPSTATRAAVVSTLHKRHVGFSTARGGLAASRGGFATARGGFATARGGFAASRGGYAAARAEYAAAQAGYASAQVGYAARGGYGAVRGGFAAARGAQTSAGKRLLVFSRKPLHAASPSLFTSVSVDIRNGKFGPDAVNLRKNEPANNASKARSSRPKGIFPDGIQPQKIVVVIDTKANYIDIPRLSVSVLNLNDSSKEADSFRKKDLENAENSITDLGPAKENAGDDHCVKKDVSILTGENLDMRGFMDIIFDFLNVSSAKTVDKSVANSTNTVTPTGALFVIVPSLAFISNKFGQKVSTEDGTAITEINENDKDKNTAAKKATGRNDKQKVEKTLLEELVQDFSTHFDSSDMSLLSHQNLVNIKNNRKNSPTIGKMCQSAVNLACHSALQLRSIVRAADSNSEVVFAGIPLSTVPMVSEGIGNEMENNIQENSLIQNEDGKMSTIKEDLENGLSIFNDLAANLWTLGGFKIGDWNQDYASSDAEKHSTVLKAALKSYKSNKNKTSEGNAKDVEKKDESKVNSQTAEGTSEKTDEVVTEKEDISEKEISKEDKIRDSVTAHLAVAIIRVSNFHSRKGVLLPWEPPLTASAPQLLDIASKSAQSSHPKTSTLKNLSEISWSTLIKLTLKGDNSPSPNETEACGNAANDSSQISESATDSSDSNLSEINDIIPDMVKLSIIEGIYRIVTREHPSDEFEFAADSSDDSLNSEREYGVLCVLCNKTFNEIRTADLHAYHREHHSMIHRFLPAGHTSKIFPKLDSALKTETESKLKTDESQNSPSKSEDSSPRTEEEKVKTSEKEAAAPACTYIEHKNILLGYKQPHCFVPLAEDYIRLLQRFKIINRYKNAAGKTEFQCLVCRISAAKYPPSFTAASMREHICQHRHRANVVRILLGLQSSPPVLQQYKNRQLVAHFSHWSFVRSLAAHEGRQVILVSDSRISHLLENLVVNSDSPIEILPGSSGTKPQTKHSKKNAKTKKSQKTSVPSHLTESERKIHLLTFPKLFTALYEEQGSSGEALGKIIDAGRQLIMGENGEVKPAIWVMVASEDLLELSSCEGYDNVVGFEIINKATAVLSHCLLHLPAHSSLLMSPLLPMLPIVGPFATLPVTKKSDKNQEESCKTDEEKKSDECSSETDNKSGDKSDETVEKSSDTANKLAVASDDKETKKSSDNKSTSKVSESGRPRLGRLMQSLVTQLHRSTALQCNLRPMPYSAPHTDASTVYRPISTDVSGDGEGANASLASLAEESNISSETCQDDARLQNARTSLVVSKWLPAMYAYLASVNYGFPSTVLRSMELDDENEESIVDESNATGNELAQNIPDNAAITSRKQLTNSDGTPSLLGLKLQSKASHFLLQEVTYPKLVRAILVGENIPLLHRNLNIPVRTVRGRFRNIDDGVAGNNDSQITQVSFMRKKLLSDLFAKDTESQLNGSGQVRNNIDTIDLCVKSLMSESNAFAKRDDVLCYSDGNYTYVAGWYLNVSFLNYFLATVDTVKSHSSEKKISDEPLNSSEEKIKTNKDDTDDEASALKEAKDAKASSNSADATKITPTKQTVPNGKVKKIENNVSVMISEPLGEMPGSSSATAVSTSVAVAIEQLLLQLQNKSHRRGHLVTLLPLQPVTIITCRDRAEATAVSTALASGLLSLPTPPTDATSWGIHVTTVTDVPLLAAQLEQFRVAYGHLNNRIASTLYHCKYYAYFGTEDTRQGCTLPTVKFVSGSSLMEGDNVQAEMSDVIKMQATRYYRWSIEVMGTLRRCCIGVPGRVEIDPGLAWFNMSVNQRPGTT